MDPNKVMAALKELAATDLYKKYGVTTREDWHLLSEEEKRSTAEVIQTKTQDDVIAADAGDTQPSLAHEPTAGSSDANVTKADDAAGNNNRNEEDIDDRVATHTAVFTNDDSEALRSQVFQVSPGFGQRPMGLWKNKDFLQIAFPDIFGGQPFVHGPDFENWGKGKMSLKEQSKYMLSARDDRARKQPWFLFVLHRLLQIEAVSSSARFSLKKAKRSVLNTEPTKADVIEQGFRHRMQQSHTGYKDLNMVRGSPAHKDQDKKNTFAIVKNRGPPTLFLTFSCDDLRWEELAKPLSKSVDGIDRTDAEIQQLSRQERERLIRDDPVLCARYYKHRMDALVHVCLLRCKEFIGKVTDYFYVDEFQKRGIGHRHMCVYCEGAPPADLSTETSRRAMLEWFSKIGCVDSAALPEHMRNKLQKHFCNTNYCKKNKRRKCCFNAPWWPLSEAMIVRPFAEDELDTDRKDKIAEKLKDCRSKLDNLDRVLHKGQGGEAEQSAAMAMTAEDFMEHVGCSQAEYVDVLRLDLIKHRPVVMLKRNVKDIRTNPFVPALSQVWDGQMDVQLVLDAYAAAVYLTTYMCKGTEGVSAMLKQVVVDFLSGKYDDYNCILKTGQQWLRCNEVCAQEAVFHVLSMPLSRKSCKVIYLDTSEPDERIWVMKEASELEELPDDSTDVTKKTPLDHFQQYHLDRVDCEKTPTQAYPDLSYAEFHMFYARKTQRPKSKDDDCMQDADEDDDGNQKQATIDTVAPAVPTDSSDTDVSANEQSQRCPLQNAQSRLCCAELYDAFIAELPQEIGSAERVYSLRTTRACIRARWFSPDCPDTIDDHDRELLLLLMPGTTWDAHDNSKHTEMERLKFGCDTYGIAIRKHAAYIAQAKKFIIYPGLENMEDLEQKVLQDLQAQEEIALEAGCDEASPENVCSDAEEALEDDLPTVDDGIQTRRKRGQAATQGATHRSAALPKLLPPEEHWKNVRRLNRGQTEVHDHVLHHLRHHNHEQLLLFITGGAGVGKSALLNVLFQTATNVSNTMIDQRDYDKQKAVVMAAMTGCTARNVGGKTVHSALGLGWGTSTASASSRTLQQQKVEWQYVDTVFIDEISLISTDSLNRINHALNNIFGTHDVAKFGGKHVILLGDLYQLPPVSGRMMFLPPKLDNAPKNTTARNPSQIRSKPWLKQARHLPTASSCTN